MNRVTKPLTVLSVSLLCSFSFILQAQVLSGTVLEKTGIPVTQGSVQIMGTNEVAIIQADGTFVFENVKPGIVEVHVASSKHVHSKTELVVPESGLFDVKIEVVNSSIEIFDVTASAFHASTIESAAPVSVIAGEELRKKQAATLGDTLKNEVGVHSTFYGSVASSPIIRGLDGPRVLVTQNGLDSGDASRVGPDHVVATDTSTATQIEVLRGPATLFYGSGAIGGVVNVVDQRIPDNNDWEGEASSERNTNNSEGSFSGFVKGGQGNIAFNLQAYYRDAEDYRIPGYAESAEEHDEDPDHVEEAEHEGDRKGLVENSSSRSKGVTFGLSYLMENGHVGFSVERMSSFYGIPGDAHTEQPADGQAEQVNAEESQSDEAEEVVKGDLQQDRYQISSKHQLNTDFISAVNTGFAYSDYMHVEIENGEVGTVFKNKSQEARIEVIHQPLGGWRGGLSFHYKASDFEAIGEEAFTPPSKTNSAGVGLIEEQHFGNVLVQLGARVERVNIDVAALQIGETAFLSGHSEAGHDMFEHDEDAGEVLSTSQSNSKSFTPLSASFGVVWDFAQGYNAGASYVHAQRAPSGAEIYSFGPHIGTSTYEVGALFDVNDDGQVIFNEDNLDLEKSNNIDVTLRKFGGDFGLVVNAFYNQVDDYYFASDTGFVIEGDHEEASVNEPIDQAHENELPVFLYTAVDVDLYGFEAQFNWQVSAALRFKAQGDLVKTKLDRNLGESKYLPRTPPTRLGVSANYVVGSWQAEMSAHRYFTQNRVAEFESATNGYTLLDLDVNYVTAVNNVDVTFYLKGRNLTNEEARVHTSFLKDITPVQGRSLILGVRANF